MRSAAGLRNLDFQVAWVVRIVVVMAVVGKVGVVWKVFVVPAVASVRVNAVDVEFTFLCKKLTMNKQ